MFELKVDLGQVIIGGLITIVGYFLRKEINTFKERLDRHDDMLLKLVGDVQRLIGISQFWNGSERRKDP